MSLQSQSNQMNRVRLERRFSNHKIERTEEQRSRGELKILIFRFSICQLLLLNQCSSTIQIKCVAA